MSDNKPETVKVRLQAEAAEDRQNLEESIIEMRSGGFLEAEQAYLECRTAWFHAYTNHEQYPFDCRTHLRKVGQRLRELIEQGLDDEKVGLAEHHIAALQKWEKILDRCVQINEITTSISALERERQILRDEIREMLRPS